MESGALIIVDYVGLVSIPSLPFPTVLLRVGDISIFLRILLIHLLDNPSVAKRSFVRTPDDQAERPCSLDEIVIGLFIL